MQVVPSPGENTLEGQPGVCPWLLAAQIPQDHRRSPFSGPAFLVGGGGVASVPIGSSRVTQRRFKSPRVRPQENGEEAVRSQRGAGVCTLPVDLPLQLPWGWKFSPWGFENFLRQALLR